MRRTKQSLGPAPIAGQRERDANAPLVELLEVRLVDREDVVVDPALLTSRPDDAVFVLVGGQAATVGRDDELHALVGNMQISLTDTEAGKPFVAEVGSKKWKDSKIIVVAGGSLLTNYAFTRPFNRRLA